MKITKYENNPDGKVITLSFPDTSSDDYGVLDSPIYALICAYMKMNGSKINNLSLMDLVLVRSRLESAEENITALITKVDSMLEKYNIKGWDDE